MDLKPFKLDIDELINEFAEGGCPTFAEMKRAWVSKKFSFIFEASPSKNQACFMQSLYAYSIGYMVSTQPLLNRLGGLYCLYCLYETQPFKPHFKIYLSLGELKKLRNLIAEAKAKDIKVVSAVVKRMLERDMILFGSMDVDEGSATERVDELTEIQNASVHVAYKKLFANSRIEHFTHMDMRSELDVDLLKQKSAEYARAKELAIKAASGMVDVENIKHIAESQTLIGDQVEKTAEHWNAQKDLFYQQTGYRYQPTNESPEQEEQEHTIREKHQKLSQEVPEEQDGDEDFSKELEESLLCEQLECD